MFWKRRPATFRQRVDAFWEWFPEVAAEFYQTIEDGRCADLQQEMGKRVSAVWDDFEWVFGPGPLSQGHSFTVSGGGVPHRQFLAQQWLSAAPEVAGWTFYASRQPTDLTDGPSLTIDGDNFVVCDLHLIPELDEDEKRVDVTVWHPLFDKVDEEKRDFALFLLLDQVLGEFGTDKWLGSIDFTSECPADAIPASRFRDYLHDLEVERGWRKLPVTESYTAYQLPSPDARFPRSDTVVGTTLNMALIEEYLHAEGPLANDPLDGSGAEFAYLAFPSSVLPKGEEASFRGEVQDAIEHQLDNCGLVLGGAIGIESTYIDLLLTDGKESLGRLRSAIQPFRLPSSQLHHFVAGRKPQNL